MLDIPSPNNKNPTCDIVLSCLYYSIIVKSIFNIYYQITFLLITSSIFDLICIILVLHLSDPFLLSLFFFMRSRSFLFSAGSQPTKNKGFIKVENNLRLFVN